jgi:hypothetical protein
MINTKDENPAQRLSLFFDFGFYSKPIIINYSGNSSFIIFL